MKSSLKIAGWIFLLLVYGSAWAEQVSIEELAELAIEDLAKIQVVTIATGSQKPTSEAPAIATVVTAQEIEAMGATTFEEALAVVPGLHVSVTGGSGAARYVIRGIIDQYNAQTLVMINGNPISSILRGDRNERMGVLPVKMISRIELIRGPGSAIYGADAFAGVINVITKSANDELHGSQSQKTEIGGGIGSFQTHQAWLFHHEKSGELKVSLMADYRETEGHKREITSDAQTALDEAFGTDLSLAPGPMSLSEKKIALWMDLEKTKWRLRGSYYGASDLGVGQGTAQALSPDARVRRDRSTLDLVFRDPEIIKKWDLTSRIAVLHGAQEIDKALYLFPPGANLGNGVFPKGVIINPDFWERQVRFDNTLIHAGRDDHRLMLGIGTTFGEIYRVEQSTNFTSDFVPQPEIKDVTDTAEAFIPEKSRHSYYGFAQDEWKFSESWTATLGARLDHYSDFGDTFNPRLALVWKTNSELTTKFLYGHAFRAPNFAELYAVNNPVTLGNPNLKPEKNNVYELGWVYQTGEDGHLGLNLFHYRIDDRINFLRDPKGTATAQNSGTQFGNGFELETKFKATKNFLLTGAYSFVKTRDEGSGKPVGNYPRHIIYARNDWGFLPQWTWSNQLNWIGPQDRIPSDPRDELEPFTTVDLIVRRKSISGSFNVAASVRNIFNDDTREPSAGPGPTATQPAIPNDLPQPERNAYFELSFQF